MRSSQSLPSSILPPRFDEALVDLSALLLAADHDGEVWSIQIYWERTLGAAKRRRLHFSLSLLSVKRAFSAPWSARLPAGRGIKLLARAETKFQSVFVPAEHGPGVLRPGSLSPARLLLLERREESSGN